MSQNHGRDAPAINSTKKLSLFEVPFNHWRVDCCSADLDCGCAEANQKPANSLRKTLGRPPRGVPQSKLAQRLRLATGRAVVPIAVC
jgi:hypothetical protein